MTTNMKTHPIDVLGQWIVQMIPRYGYCVELVEWQPPEPKVQSQERRLTVDLQVVVARLDQARRMQVPGEVKLQLLDAMVETSFRPSLPA